MMKSNWQKKYNSYAMTVQSTTSSNDVSLKKGKEMAQTPYKEEIAEKKQPLTTHSSTLGQHSFMMFRYNLPKCNSANLEQSFEKSGSQEGEAELLQISSFGKECKHAFIFMYTSFRCT